jgi:hypothetical protein
MLALTFLLALSYPECNEHLRKLCMHKGTSSAFNDCNLAICVQATIFVASCTCFVFQYCFRIEESDFIKRSQEKFQIELLAHSYLNVLRSV